MKHTNQRAVSWLEKKLYAAEDGWVDGTTQFHAMCRDAVNARRGEGPAKILEVGAGPSNRTSRFLRTLGEVHGVDVDPEVLKNDALSGAHVVTNDNYPFSAQTFDLCVSNFVIEHVESPSTHFREIFRVLKPGGRYVFRTPNLFHYVAATSRLTPQWFHVLVANRLRDLPVDAHDPWPTHYAANTPAAIRRFAGEAGFKVHQLDVVEKEPSYGRGFAPLYAALAVYERAVNSTQVLEPLRSTVFGSLER